VCTLEEGDLFIAATLHITACVVRHSLISISKKESEITRCDSAVLDEITRLLVANSIFVV
jgi:hypothetical protein